MGRILAFIQNTQQKLNSLFFDCVDDTRPKRVISIDPAINRTYHYQVNCRQHIDTNTAGSSDEDMKKPR